MLEIYQRDDYYHEGASEGYTGYSEQASTLTATFAKLTAKLHHRGLTGGSLLEVGCGFGFLLKAAAPYFETRHGTDFSPEAVRQAATRADRVFQGGVEALPAELRYDCVMTNHVIEHVYRPLSFTRQLAGRLNPGGIMVITTPDMGGLWRRLLGKRWPSFKIPEHVLFWDQTSLTELMSQAGLETIQAMPYPHAFPLSLVAAKLGLRTPRFFKKVTLWIPGTTLALHGRKPKNES